MKFRLTHILLLISTVLGLFVVFYNVQAKLLSQPAIGVLPFACSAPNYPNSFVDPTGPDIQDDPSTNGRYIAWMEGSNSNSGSGTLNIAFLDLGPDGELGTADDGVKTLVGSNSSVNQMPRINENGELAWVAGQKHILHCTLPNCSPGQVNILYTAAYGLVGKIFELDFSGDIIAFREKAPGYIPGFPGLQFSELGVYDLVSNSPSIITLPGLYGTIDLKDDLFVYAYAQGPTDEADLYAYEVGSGTVTQITDTPQQSEYLPAVDVASSFYFIAFNRDFDPAYAILQNNNVLVVVDMPDGPLITQVADLEVNSQGIMNILLRSFTTQGGDNVFLKRIFAAGSTEIGVPSVPNIGYADSLPILKNNHVFFPAYLVSDETKIAVSSCP